MASDSAGLPFTESGIGAVRFGDATLRTGYQTRRYGQENGQFSLGLQNRHLTGNGAWLLDALYNVDFADSSTMGLNVGGGFRRLHESFFGDGGPRIFGTNLWYDGSNTRMKNYFNQIGIGLESLGPRWDFRLNANIPVGSTRQTGTSTPTGELGYHGLFLSSLTDVAIDQAVSVVDLEAACRIRDLEAWLFAGGYSLEANGESEAGFKAGGRGYVGDDLQMQLAVTHDEFFGTEVTFGLIWYPGRTRTFGRPADAMENRLREPVIRNDYIAIRRDLTHGSVTLTDADGDPIRVVHVDSNAAGAGDGTYENPFTSLDDVYDGSETGDIVLVHAGSTHTGEAIVLRDFQRLLGEGGNHAHSVTTSQLGDITLPETSVGALAAAIPIIGNAPATAVTLASGSTNHSEDVDVSSNEVSNLSITGGTRGIASAAGVGIATANINYVTIANTTSHGIQLARFEETITETGDSQSRFSPTIDHVTFDNVGGDDINLAATTAQTTVTENIRITNVTSNDVTGRGIYIAGNEKTATIQHYTYDGGTTGAAGIVFSATEAGATLSNVSITGGAANSQGISIEGGSEGTFSLTSTTLTNVGAVGAGGTAFNLNGSAATVTFSGTITNDDDAFGQSVVIDGNTGGLFTFTTGTITDEGEGILVQNNTAGSFLFNGQVNLDTVANDAVQLLTNTGATIGFANLQIDTTTGNGFTATGGGTIQLTGNNNTIATTTGTALNMNGVTISSSGARFKSISANGAANGILLDTLNGTGTLSVGSSGTSVGDGGTIAGTTDHAVSITDAANVSLNHMSISTGTAAMNGIYVSQTTGTTHLTLTGNQVTQTNAASAFALNTSAGTTYLVSTGNTFDNDNAANAAFYANASGTSTLNANVNTGNSFTNGSGRAFEMENANTATVRLSLLDNQGSGGGGNPAFLLNKGGGSFGVVLLNPLDPVTTECVNERNGGTGKYAGYDVGWVIELTPLITDFTNLNAGSVPQ